MADLFGKGSVRFFETSGDAKWFAIGYDVGMVALKSADKILVA